MRKFLLALVACLVAVIAYAQPGSPYLSYGKRYGGGGGTTVAFDASSGANAPGAGVASLSWTHTPVGTPTAVFVAVGVPASAAAPSSVTYGGTSMGAAIVTNHTSNFGTCFIYGLANPTAGAQTVVVTFGATSSGAAEAITVTGSNTTTASDFSNSAVDNTGTATSISVTTTSVANDLVFSAATNENTSSLTFTDGASQTRVADQLYDSNVKQLVTTYKASSGASTTMSESTGSADRYVICAASIKHG